MVHARAIARSKGAAVDGMDRTMEREQMFSQESFVPVATVLGRDR